MSNYDSIVSWHADEAADNSGSFSQDSSAKQAAQAAVCQAEQEEELMLHDSEEEELMLQDSEVGEVQDLTTMHNSQEEEDEVELVAERPATKLPHVTGLSWSLCSAVLLLLHHGNI